MLRTMIDLIVIYRKSSKPLYSHSMSRQFAKIFATPIYMSDGCSASLATVFPTTISMITEIIVVIKFNERRPENVRCSELLSFFALAISRIPKLTIPNMEKRIK